MSDIPKIDKLKILNDKLTALLNDRKMGTFTWHIALSEVLTDIAEFAPKPELIDYSTWDCYWGSAWKECTPTRELECNHRGKCIQCPSVRYK